MKKFLNGLNGFRKWSMALIFIVVATTLLVMDYVPGDTWMQYMSSVMVAFMATNIGEHIIKTVKEWKKSDKIEDTIDAAKKKLGL